MSKAKFIESTKRILDHYLVDYELVDEEKGLFHCRNKQTNEVYCYYSSTGKVVNYNVTGVYNLLQLLSYGKFVNMPKLPIFYNYGNTDRII